MQNDPRESQKRLIFQKKVAKEVLVGKLRFCDLSTHVRHHVRLPGGHDVIVIIGRPHIDLAPNLSMLQRLGVRYAQLVAVYQQFFS
jgi:hypothetical protein